MEDKALIELMRDMLSYKKKEAKYLFIALVAVIVMNLLMVGAFLYFESHMVTTTTTTTTQTVDGDDADIVNGDQYNDQSENRSNNGSDTNNHNDHNKEVGRKEKQYGKDGQVCCKGIFCSTEKIPVIKQTAEAEALSYLW